MSLQHLVEDMRKHSQRMLLRKIATLSDRKPSSSQEPVWFPCELDEGVVAHRVRIGDRFSPAVVTLEGARSVLDALVVENHISPRQRRSLVMKFKSISLAKDDFVLLLPKFEGVISSLRMINTVNDVELVVAIPYLLEEQD